MVVEQTGSDYTSLFNIAIILWLFIISVNSVFDYYAETQQIAGELFPWRSTGDTMSSDWQLQHLFNLSFVDSAK